MWGVGLLPARKEATESFASVQVTLTTMSTEEDIVAAIAAKGEQIKVI